MSTYTEELKKKEELRAKTMKEAIDAGDFYSLDPILKKHARYYVIFGARSQGKTYASLTHSLERFKKDGTTFVYCRRWGADIVMKLMNKLFDPLQKEIDRIFGPGYKVRYWRGAFILHNEEDDEVDDQTIGWAIALNEAHHVKGGTFENCRVFIYDEFLKLLGEKNLKDEYSEFKHNLSSVLRGRENTEIFLLGNSVSRYSEYFSKLHIEVTKLEQGKIKVIEIPNKYGEIRRIAVEWCEFNEAIGSRTASYIIDDDDMAITGQWEMRVVDSIPYDEGEIASEKLLCTLFDFDMKINIGLYVRTATYFESSEENGLYTTKPHRRQFIVIREADKKSSYHHCTIIKDLKYNSWNSLKRMLKHIVDTTGIDIVDELDHGRVFAEDMFIADNFVNVYRKYSSLELQDLL